MTEESRKNPIRPKLILFDVFETLLDISSVKSRLNDALHNKRGYRIWLELCMQYAFVDIITGEYHSFGDHSKEALRTASELFGQPLSSALNDDIFLLMQHAPLHEDAQEGLSRLSNDGYQLAAISNISAKVLQNRMESTGLISYFEFILSADDIRQYKPAGAAYAAAAKKAAVPASEILMVTAHWWDLRGASAAGMQTAFLRRNTQSDSGLFAAPSFAAEDAGNLADTLRITFSDVSY